MLFLEHGLWLLKGYLEASMHQTDLLSFQLSSSRNKGFRDDHAKSMRTGE